VYHYICQPNEVEVDVALPGLPPVAENRPKEVAQGPQDCLSVVGKPITVTTGNMYTQQEDLAYPSAFRRFAFTRTYNSQATYSGPLGLGWSHPYEYELKELRPGVLRVRTGAGNIRFYDLADAATQTYRVGAPAQEAATLVKHDTGYTETEPDGLVREYNPAGQLLTIRNRAGWQTTLTYSGGQLATVTDPGGRSLTFGYTDGKLTRVEGPGGLFAAYTYDAQGRLTAESDALGLRGPTPTRTPIPATWRASGIPMGTWWRSTPMTSSGG
jgi:YD repeat-containing protein